MRHRTGGRIGLLFAALASAAGVFPTGAAPVIAGEDPETPVEWVQAVEDTAPPAATPILEAPAEGDTLVAPPDSLTVPLSRVRRAEREEDSGPPNVAWTTIRSGILPGWGQLANGKPLKAVLLGGIYTGWAAGAYMAETDRRDFKKALDANPDDPVLTDRVNEAVNRRNFRMWMMGATMLYAMIDAYVDVHFVGYEETWSAGFRPDAPALAVTVRF